MVEIELDRLNELADSEFVELLKDIFEHSPWVAERVSSARPFTSIRALHSAMVEAVGAASHREQMDLICAHPDLAGKAALAGNLTDASTSEQAGAGLDMLSEDELREFTEVNNAYQSKFGFPFIIAVKGHDKTSIIAAFHERIKNEHEEERKEALHQIAEIGRFRLEAMITH